MTLISWAFQDAAPTEAPTDETPADTAPADQTPSESAPADASPASEPGESQSLSAADLMEPLFQGEATLLWGVFAGSLFFFFLVIMLIMRGRVARTKRMEAAADRNFFKPAGEDAEINFDADAEQHSTQHHETAEAEGWAAVEIDHDAKDTHDDVRKAALVDDDNGVADLVLTPDEGEPASGRKTGAFAGLFAKKNKGDAPEHSAPTDEPAPEVDAEPVAEPERMADTRLHQDNDADLRLDPIDETPGFDRNAFEREQTRAREEAAEIRRQAEEEAHRIAEEARQIEETARRQAEEDARRAAEQTRQAEEAARRHAEEEARRIAEEARINEENARRIAAEEARLQAEREAEFERRKQAAATEQQMRRAESADIERHLTHLMEDRFAQLADRFDRHAQSLHSAVVSSERPQPHDPQLHADVAQIHQRIDENRRTLDAALASANAARAADADIRSEIAAFNQRLDDHRNAVDQALVAIAGRLNQLSTPSSETDGLRSDIADLRLALSGRFSAPVAPMVQLMDVVGNVLAPDAYDINKQLKNNRTADCLIHLPAPAAPIAIDARFPVEAYTNLQKARLSQDSVVLNQAETHFRRLALQHIVEIAERLIAPPETAEAALMFVPTESIYIDLHAHFADVVQDAYRAHVWIVAPTSLMAMLHSLRAVMRTLPTATPPDAAVEMTAKEVLDELDEVDALHRRVEMLERNLDEKHHPSDVSTAPHSAPATPQAPAPTQPQTAPLSDRALHPQEYSASSYQAPPPLQQPAPAHVPAQPSTTPAQNPPTQSRTPSWNERINTPSSEPMGEGSEQDGEPSPDRPLR